MRFMSASLAILLTAAVSFPALAAENSAVVPVTQNRDRSVYDWPTRHRQELDYIQHHKVDLVFIGDSITHYFGGEPAAPLRWAQDVWDHYYGRRNAVNEGFGWDRTENVLWRIGHGELDGISPKAVVVLIGTNNLDVNTPPQIAAGITAVCAAIHTRCPAAKILLVGILPRDKHHRTHPEQVNPLIAPLGKRPYITYLDVSQVFLDAHGELTPAMYRDGGTHPSHAGYAAYAAALEPTLAKLMGEEPIR